MSTVGDLAPYLQKRYGRCLPLRGRAPISNPWDALSPETWRRLLEIVFLEDDFDPQAVGLEAGLAEAEIAALQAWCRHVTHEDEVRRRRGEMMPSTLRFLQSLKDGATPEEQGQIDAEIRSLREKTG